jgi:hypothetical protein
MTGRRPVRHPERSEGFALSLARSIALTILTPLLEKNVLKTITFDIPVVFSMSRVIVLAFAAAMIRQIWRTGIAGWPDATLAIAVVLALPIVGALDRAKPRDVLSVAKTLLGRFGVGSGTEPSKFDDHRAD